MARDSLSRYDTGVLSRYDAPVVFDPVGLADIAARLKRPKITVRKWREKGELPDAEAEVSGMPVWRWVTIEKWARKTGRLPEG